ncbi:MAG: alpha/beta fold hydrolase [Candidatus Hydrogenedens sp.]|nr:alpha/beta fold hydrolase [Candidatus Hydrogenedens sp.]
MKSWLKAITIFIFVALAATGAYGYFTLFHRSPGEYFEQDGVRLFYSDGGAGEAVVLLHGFSVNGDLNWQLNGLAPDLREDYRVIVLDQRAHGLSSKPEDPAAYGAEMAEDVVRLLDHLGINKAHVAGYSLGGYVALKVAAMHPDRLLSASVLGAGWQDPEDAQGQAMFDGFEKLAAQLESGKSVDPVATMFGDETHKPTAWHRLQVRLATSLLGNKKALAAMLRNVRGLAVEREAVAAIDTPLLVVCGELDPNFISAQKLRDVHPSCTFVSVPGKSHPATAMSSELREALFDFLREHPGTP